MKQLLLRAAVSILVLLPVSAQNQGNNNAGSETSVTPIPDPPDTIEFPCKHREPNWRAKSHFYRHVLRHYKECSNSSAPVTPGSAASVCVRKSKNSRGRFLPQSAILKARAERSKSPLLRLRQTL